MFGLIEKRSRVLQLDQSPNEVPPWIYGVDVPYTCILINENSEPVTKQSSNLKY